MKLKTLKDFAKFKLNKVENWNKSKWKSWNETRASKSNIAFDKDLKAEAVKWVKEYKTHYDGYAEIEFIKHFFNLTEEDLK